MHVIIEMSDAHNWETFPGGQLPAPPLAPTKIPERRRPTVLQASREIAEQECLRLANEHPGSKFVVFAPICAGITAKVATHTTLAGKVIAERAIATVVQFQEEEVEDGLPF